MLKEAIEKIVSLADPHIYQVGKDFYTNDNMTRIEPHIDRLEGIKFASLDSVAKAIRTEISKVTCPIFVCVRKHDQVEVFTTYREDNFQRDTLYVASPDLPTTPGAWNSYDDAMIILRSRYIQNTGTAYILELLSKITDENSVSTSDNGLSQAVTARQGISLTAKVPVSSRVKLCPYRTFLEVEQPESEYLLRLREGGQIGLIEADGGAWKLEAKKNVAGYFEEKLKDLIESGTVVVAE